MPSFPFATFLIVCPTSFFLGIIFALFPYDYPVLWSTVATTSAHYDLVEAHLKVLHQSPHLIPRILHIMTFLGLLGLVLKLYKPSESNMLFDGGSLVLYMVAVIVYITNVVKGLRIVSAGSYGLAPLDQLDQDTLDNTDGAGFDRESGISILGREDNLKVLAASNTILALVLVGVLVLQVGQWYAERADERERKKMLEQQQEEKEKKDTAASSASANVQRKPSNKESRKAR